MWSRDHINLLPDVGYIVTEFLPNVSWAGAYNTIAGTAGHHIMEGTFSTIEVVSRMLGRPAHESRAGTEPQVCGSVSCMVKI